MLLSLLEVVIGFPLWRLISPILKDLRIDITYISLIMVSLFGSDFFRLVAIIAYVVETSMKRTHKK